MLDTDFDTDCLDLVRWYIYGEVDECKRIQWACPLPSIPFREFVDSFYSLIIYIFSQYTFNFSKMPLLGEVFLG